MKSVLIAVLAFMAALGAQARLNVVATTPDLASIAQEVGGVLTLDARNRLIRDAAPGIMGQRLAIAHNPGVSLQCRRHIHVQRRCADAG